MDVGGGCSDVCVFGGEGVTVIYYSQGWET